MCSFTFDDCPLSALQVAGAALEEAGTAGTFFVSAHFAARKESREESMMGGDDLVQARSAGHEIGCHSYSHSHLWTLGREALRSEFDLNLEAIRDTVPDITLSSFAYPFGEVSFRMKAVVASRFQVARGVRPGFNGRVIDLSELRSFDLRAPTFDEDWIQWLVRETVRRRAWLVFVGHDVSNRPSEWGCTPHQFHYALRSVVDAGIPVLPLKAALGRAMHRQPTK